ncbi:MAG: hypothetical protein RIC30_13690 [Marinoscillum sp.]|uniref:hypothetical protein n=1 Tax=Marinoscillum sp. TaxID=2024838 RepID=UPI0032F18BF1
MKLTSKIKLTILGLLISIAAMSCNGCKPTNEKLFSEYLGNFEKGVLPLVINKKNLFSFYRMIYDESSGEHKKNRFADITSQFFNFVQSYNDFYDYRYFLKYEINDELIAVIVIKDHKEDSDEQEFWFELIVYNYAGEIQSRVTIAGYLFDQIEQFVLINENFDILSYSYQLLEGPDKTNYNMYARETKVKYTIDRLGKIEVDSNVTESYFTDDGNWYKSM